MKYKIISIVKINMSKKTITKSKSTKRRLHNKKKLRKTHRKTKKQSGGNGYYLDLTNSVSLGQPVRQGYSECSPPIFVNGKSS